MLGTIFLKKHSKTEEVLTSNALVPLSIKSNFVRTPNVLSPGRIKYFLSKDNNWSIDVSSTYKRTVNKPVGSTSLASLIASDVAMSWLAGDIASMIQLGCK